MEGEQGSLNGRREVIRGELRRNVMGQLKDQIYLEDEQLYEQIDTAIRQKGKETYLPLKERLWLRNSLYDSFRRLDILQELLDDKDVTEIMINGAGKIFIEKLDPEIWCFLRELMHLQGRSAMWGFMLEALGCCIVVRLLAMRTLLLLTGTAICMLLEGWQLFRNEAAKNEICADLPGQFMDM